MSLSKRVVISLIFAMFVMCCNDGSDSSKNTAGSDEAEPRLILGSKDAGAEADIPIILSLSSLLMIYLIFKARSLLNGFSLLSNLNNFSFFFFSPLKI